MRRDLPCIPRLIVLLVVETDGERPDGLRRAGLCDCCDERGIIPAAQKSPERHIRDHPLPDCALQKTFQLRARLAVLRRPRSLLPVVDLADLPVLVHPDLSLCKFQHASRFELVNMLKNALRRFHILLVEIPAEDTLVDPPGKSRVRHDRFEFGGKDQIPALVPIIERFLPDPVPDQP